VQQGWWSGRAGWRGRWCARLIGAAAVPCLLTEISERPFCEQIDLNLLEDDSWIVNGSGEFKAPNFYPIFVEDRDRFTLLGCETAGGAWSFDQQGETFGLALCGRGAHSGLPYRVTVGGVADSVKRVFPRAPAQWAGHEAGDG
jgi:hypothetical protein